MLTPESDTLLNVIVSTQKDSWRAAFLGADTEFLKNSRISIIKARDEGHAVWEDIEARIQELLDILDAELVSRAM